MIDITNQVIETLSVRRMAGPTDGTLTMYVLEARDYDDLIYQLKDLGITAVLRCENLEMGRNYTIRGVFNK